MQFITFLGNMPGDVTMGTSGWFNISHFEAILQNMSCYVAVSTEGSVWFRMKILFAS